MAYQIDRKFPRIRFKQFTDSWTEEKIGTVLAEKRRPIVLRDDKRYELITVRRRSEGVVSRGCLLGREILVKNYAQLKTGDFVISKRQVAHGATGIVPPELDGAIVSNEYLTAVDSDKLLTEFMALVAGLPTMRRELFLSSYGVDIEKLFFDVDDWKRRGITIPETAEQTRIASFFHALDQLIELQRRKYSKLLSLRRAMVRTMFPRPGLAKPEVRFKGYSKDWGLIRLEEICQRIVRKNSNLESLRPLTISARDGLVDQTQYFTKRVAAKDISSYFLLRRGEFAYNKSYSEGFPFGAIRRLDRYEDGVLSTLYIVFSQDSERANSDFLVSFFSTDLWHSQVASFCSEGARNHGLLNISAKDFFKIKLRLPLDLDEQQKVGEYFRRLDELISKYGAGIQKIQELKAAYLERMFV